MSSRRWKLATFVFATATVLLALRDEPAAPTKGQRPTYTGPATPTIMLRKSGSSVRTGLDEATLIAELRAERDPRRAVLLIDRLGKIGGELAVEALVDFVDDRRPGVATSTLFAIGSLGTESAAEFLLSYEQHGVPKFRSNTVSALGATLHDKARVRLLAIATTPDDPERHNAVGQLYKFEDENVVKALAQIATSAEYWTARAAISGLGEMTLASARSALLALLQSPDSRIVALALDAISDLGSDEASLAQLYALLETGDATVAAAAATALGRTGNLDVLVALERTARTGAEDARSAAVAAIAELGGEESIALLARLLSAGNKITARAAAEALVESGEDDAREIMLAAARKPGAARVEVLRALRELRGADVEELMLDVGRTGTSDERELAFQNLIESGSTRGFALAAAAAKSGSEGTYVIAMLAQGPSRDARRALEDIARDGRGANRLTALDYLAELGIDGSTQKMLTDLLATGDNETRKQAAAVLAKSGSRDARNALRGALGGSDVRAADAAMRVLLDADASADARDAIVQAARANPTLREQAIDALLEQGAPEGITLAREALAGDDESLAGDAAHALGRADDANATEVLLASAASSQPSARLAAAKALASRGDPRSRDALNQLARDTNPEVRAEAYDGLADLGTPEAITALARIATSADDADRREAIDALGSARGDLGHDALRAAMADPSTSPEARIAAARQLDHAGALAESDRHFLEEPAERDAETE